jgi:hypothetical protein
MGREAFDEALQGNYENIICFLADKSSSLKKAGDSENMQMELQ